jgi:hypothetical protein
MKVSRSVLERVYETFQLSQEDPLTAGTVYLDPETNFYVIDAFELPLWNWSIEKSGFDKLRAFELVSVHIILSTSLKIFKKPFFDSGSRVSYLSPSE